MLLQMMDSKINGSQNEKIEKHISAELHQKLFKID